MSGSSAVVHFDVVVLDLSAHVNVFSWFRECCVWCTMFLNFHYVKLFTGIESSCLYSLFIITVYTCGAGFA